jgi:hypothetical protein
MKLGGEGVEGGTVVMENYSDTFCTLKMNEVACFALHYIINDFVLCILIVLTLSVLKTIKISWRNNIRSRHVSDNIQRNGISIVAKTPPRICKVDSLNSLQFHN